MNIFSLSNLSMNLTIWIVYFLMSSMLEMFLWVWVSSLNTTSSNLLVQFLTSRICGCYLLSIYVNLMKRNLILSSGIKSWIFNFMVGKYCSSWFISVSNWLINRLEEKFTQAYSFLSPPVVYKFWLQFGNNFILYIN